MNARILFLWDTILVKAHQRKIIGLILRAGRTVKISTLHLQTLWSLICTNGEWRQKQKWSYSSWSLENGAELLSWFRYNYVRSNLLNITFQRSQKTQKSCCFATVIAKEGSCISKLLTWSDTKFMNKSLPWRGMFDSFKWVVISTAETKSHVHFSCFNLDIGFALPSMNVCISCLRSNISFNIFSRFSYRTAD